jgi:hypothetical protein
VIRPRLSLLAAAILLAVAPTTASASLQGKYLQRGAINFKAVHDDPIVNPNQPGAADHPHDECGSKSWSANPAPGLLRGSAGTSMTNPFNFTAYWAPSWVAADGSLVSAIGCGGYYKANFAHPDMIAGGKIVDYAPGSQIVIGNSHSTSLQSTAIVNFRCNAAGQPTLAAPPKTCPAGVGVAAIFFGPSCWSGTGITPSNFTYTKTQPNGVQECDPDELRVPTLEWEFDYPPAAVGGCPSSDHGIAPCGRSAHMDTIEMQDPLAQPLLDACLNDPAHNVAQGTPTCGTLTSSSSPWLVPLIGWTAKHDYIANADGSPAPGP